MSTEPTFVELHEISSFRELDQLYSYRMGLIQIATKLINDFEAINKAHPGMYDFDTLTEIVITSQEQMEILQTYWGLAKEITLILAEEDEDTPPF